MGFKTFERNVRESAVSCKLEAFATCPMSFNREVGRLAKSKTVLYIVFEMHPRLRKGEGFVRDETCQPLSQRAAPLRPDRPDLT